MGPYFASLLKAPAFVAAIGLWARLQFLVDEKAQGIGQLRRNLRSNASTEEFRHHIALARLAVLARQLGAGITLEPVKPQGGPGDLRTVRADSDVFIEVRALWPDKAFRAHDRLVAEARTHFLVLKGRHDVHWKGELPSDPGPHWQRATEAAAAEVAATGDAVEVTLGDATLTARPGPAPIGTKVAGPLWEADQEPRLLHALVRKALKTQSAGAPSTHDLDAPGLPAGRAPAFDESHYPSLVEERCAEEIPARVSS